MGTTNDRVYEIPRKKQELNYHMKLKTYIIILSLFYFTAISKNVKQDSCQLYFKEIGIRDFTLGSNYAQFIKDSKSLKRKFKKESVYGIDIVTFNENIILLKEKKLLRLI